MSEQFQRLSYVDADFVRGVVADVSTLSAQSRRRLADEPGKLVQRRQSMLAADMAMLAAYHYALGEPIEVVVGELREAAERQLKVFELRGTESPFPVTVVTLDIDSSAEAPEVISREPLHPAGSKDYSLTNSRFGLMSIYAALASGHVLVAQRLAQLIWDPPHADYIGERSEVCTPDDQHLAYAVKYFILGSGAKAREEIDRVKTDRPAIALQVPIVRSLIDRDGDAFLNVLGAYLKWHEKEARKKSNWIETDLYLSLPALGQSVLALRAGMIRIDDLPSESPHFPIELLQMTMTEVTRS